MALGRRILNSVLDFTRKVEKRIRWRNVISPGTSHQKCSLQYFRSAKHLSETFWDHLRIITPVVQSHDLCAEIFILLCQSFLLLLFLYNRYKNNTIFPVLLSLHDLSLYKLSVQSQAREVTSAESRRSYYRLTDVNE